MLVKRAIEPGYGKWVFPGGYVDRGEEITSDVSTLENPGILDQLKQAT